ncbi:MAG: tRNA uridine-5-carboxymethylaminomethyl(34) synthesis GTPase MnmE [Gammaproteobacteria bacterium]|nr:tRNA uridine-5-carboxymethylaminomethyl(34) synthesis GTPase MnmE [Gammaproteobacteria bacterium]MCI0590239.1 tRNA uridine-5-carboxymethylaminomethyl(34) synthesis GTPase MnmE [Gammaproteobacteria bacterium]
MPHTPDTIAAVATPPGRGGIGIVRISGPLVGQIARALVERPFTPRTAQFSVFKDDRGEVIDFGIALLFPGPKSFTGEDVLELQGHGGPVVMDVLLRRIIELGARLARPGEFSERAFLNGKLDLAQVEAIADLIDSASQQAARCAMRSLEGAFSSRIHALVDLLVDLRAHIEGALDFPEEEIDFLNDSAIEATLHSFIEQVDRLNAEAEQGCLLREGMRIAIIGRPNVGKSSLLNRLADQDLAIVTSIPGTTRDVIREEILIDGFPIHVADTAGLRFASDEVEEEGIRRTWEAVGRSDRILFVVECKEVVDSEDHRLLGRLQKSGDVTVVHNKIDLQRRQPGMDVHDHLPNVYLSAKTGEGIELLRAHLKECAGYNGAMGEGGFMARRRHLDALARARAFAQKGLEQLTAHRAGELLAEELRLAQQALGEVTGEFTSEDLLAQIFSRFCIGK